MTDIIEQKMCALVGEVRAENPRASEWSIQNIALREPTGRPGKPRSDGPSHQRCGRHDFGRLLDARDDDRDPVVVDERSITGP